MRLAVFVDQVFFFDGHCYSTNESFIRFVTAFDPYVDRIIFYARVVEGHEPGPYRLDPARTAVYALPWYESLYALWARGWSIMPPAARLFDRTCHEWDLLWLGMPHPLAVLFARQCRRRNKPFFMVVRQNLLEQVRHRNKGIKKLVAMATTMVLERWARTLARTHPTFTVGEELRRLYKRDDNPVFPTTVSLISARDIVTTRKARSTPGRAVRLLSVGRLDPEKRLTYLLAALHMLNREMGLDASLTIVGTGPEEPRLRQEVVRLGLDRHVRFRGYVAFGPELLQIYQDNDIFVLPSLTEGLPQVLLEAMACGVPVVASAVGGIPQLITDGENGLLVDPADACQLAAAVRRLAEDRRLEQRICDHALQTAGKHTIEAEVDAMIRALRSCFPQCWPPSGTG